MLLCKAFTANKFCLILMHNIDQLIEIYPKIIPPARLSTGKTLIFTFQGKNS